MFQTADEVSKGRFFWRSLERLQRPPYDCVLSGAAATFVDQAQGLGLILMPVENEEPLEEGRRVGVQLRRLLEGDVLVDATLNADMQYLFGVALGLPADELAAAETLGMYLSDANGEWVVESDEEVEEGEHV